MSTEVQNLFDTISPTYDTLNHLLSLGVDRYWRKKSLRALSPQKNKNYTALDLCAGTLDLSLEFLNLYPQSQVVSLDFAINMLKSGLPKIPKNKKNQISIINGDALHLPFKNNSFDFIFCAYGMRNLDDNQKGLQEIYRVLKPNGKFFALEFFRPTRTPSKIFHATIGKYWLPFMGGLVSGNKSAYTYLFESIQKYYSLVEYQKLMLKLNFKNIQKIDFFGGVSSMISGMKESL